VPFIHETIGDLLKKRAVIDANEIAYIFNMNNGLELTFAECLRRAEIMAQNLLHLGLRKGDRLAVLFPNTHELLISYFACALTGVISVPLIPFYTKDELAYMLGKVQPHAVMAYNIKDYEENIDTLFPDINSFRKGEYESKNFSNLKHLVFLTPKTHENKYKNAWTYEEIANEFLNKSRYPYPVVDPDDAFVIIFTVKTRLYDSVKLSSYKIFQFIVCTFFFEK
jgi:acyl-CoA synthetase (AMP-forming)/AMP-acid ligase II